MPKAVKRRSAEEEIRAAVRRIMQCGRFAPVGYPVPARQGAQLSMTGLPEAWGNGGGLDPAAVAAALAELPSAPRFTPASRELYAARGRFVILPGDCDRYVAAAAVLTEVFRAGVLKVVVAADTPAERNGLIRFLRLARESAGCASVVPCVPEERRDGAAFRIAAAVFEYLTAQASSAFVVSRDSFCRRTNLLRRVPEDEEAGGDLCALIGSARPIVLCSSRTVAGGRTLARCAEVFDPAATFLVAGESGRIRDAVIFRPVRRIRKAKAPKEPEQLGMF